MPDAISQTNGKIQATFPFMTIRLKRARDRSGEQHGYVKVIEPAGKDPTGKNILWRCYCENCGSETLIRGVNLNDTYSCGCVPPKYGRWARNWAGHGQIPASLISRIHQKARSRRYHFAVDAKYLWELFLRQNGRCALSGVILSLPRNRNDIDAGLFSASLDRIDSAQGYVPGNVQWVLKPLNMMKQQLSQKDFIALCHAVSDYQRQIAL